MSPRATGLLLAVTLALSAFVYFYEIRGESARQAAADAEGQLFPGLSAEEIQSIEIGGSEGARIRVLREAGVWRLVEPHDAPADRAAIAAMERALVAMRREGRIEDPAAAGIYGLDESALVVVFRRGEESHPIRFGNQAPIGPNVYVGVGEVGSLDVYMIRSIHVAAFERAANELRDTRLLDIEPAEVRRMTLSAPGFAATLERSADDWTIVAPGPLPADRAAVERLLSDLSLLRAEIFVDDPDGSERRALDPPVYEIALEGEAGVALGGLALGPEESNSGGLRLARGREHQIVRIRAALVAHLPRRLFALRYKQVSRFDPRDVRQLEVRFASGESLRLTKSDSAEGWMSAEGDVREEPADAIVERLERLEATDIVADALGPQERASFALEPARLRLTVRGEATDEDPAGVVLADVRLGARSVLQGPMALSGDREQVYRLDNSFDNLLPPDMASFERALAIAEPAEPAPAAARAEEEEREEEERD